MELKYETISLKAIEHFLEVLMFTAFKDNSTEQWLANQQ